MNRYKLHEPPPIQPNKGRRIHVGSRVIKDDLHGVVIDEFIHTSSDRFFFKVRWDNSPFPPDLLSEMALKHEHDPSGPLVLGIGSIVRFNDTYIATHPDHAKMRGVIVEELWKGSKGEAWKIKWHQQGAWRDTSGELKRNITDE